jgi:hypothetical protein
MYRPDWGHFSPVRKNVCVWGASFLVAAGVFGLGAVLGFVFRAVLGFGLAAAVLGFVLGAALAFGAALGLEAFFLAVFFAAM